MVSNCIVLLDLFKGYIRTNMSDPISSIDHNFSATLYGNSSASSDTAHSSYLPALDPSKQKGGLVRKSSNRETDLLPKPKKSLLGLDKLAVLAQEKRKLQQEEIFKTPREKRLTPSRDGNIHKFVKPRGYSHKERSRHDTQHIKFRSRHDESPLSYETADNFESDRRKYSQREREHKFTSHSKFRDSENSNNDRKHGRCDHDRSEKNRHSRESTSYSNSSHYSASLSTSSMRRKYHSNSKLDQFDNVCGREV